MKKAKDHILKFQRVFTSDSVGINMSVSNAFSKCRPKGPCRFEDTVMFLSVWTDKSVQKV